MAIEFMDGFDHWTTNSFVARKWDTNSNAIGLSAGRFGGNCLGQFSGPGSTIALSQGQLSAVATRVIGFALQPTNVWASGNSFITILDGATEQISVRSGTAGVLIVSRSGTTLATSTNVLPLNIWCYLEFKCTINSSTGSFELRVNGTSTGWCSGSGVNTQTTANPTTNGFKIFGSNNINFSLDDLYVLNTSGSANNDFLGECRVNILYPVQDSLTGWTTSTGTSHFALVDETNPNDDTDYVYSNTANQEDTYFFSSLATSGAIAGIQNVACMRKDDIGLKTVSIETFVGGSGVVAPAFTPASSYLMYRQIVEQDPSTSAPWTPTTLFNANCGVKIIT